MSPLRAVLAAVVVLTLPLTGCLQQEDGDGLAFDVEKGGWVVIVTDVNCIETRDLVTSDPQLTDTDGDGLNDFSEFQLGSNPQSPDTDGDGIKEGPTVRLDPDDERLAAWRSMGLLEVPEGSRTFPGEDGFPMNLDGETVTVSTDPLKANTDSCPDITDELDDRTEIEGWSIVVGGQPKAVWSHPGFGRADTDGDGLHDGFEREFRTDPWNQDTDGDGVNDLRDAFPLCNARLVFDVPRIDLKNNKDPERVPSGGADLQVNIIFGGTAQTWGPHRIPLGESRPNKPLEFDLDDTGSGLPGNDRWEQDILLEVLDQDTAAGDDPINVKGGDGGNQLVIRYNATTSTWTGDAFGGTTDGPDARLTIDLETRCQ